VRKTSLKPGDIVLLKSGDTWEDWLYLRGEGTEDAYIQVSSYGKGDKPLLIGPKQDESILMQIDNPSYWSIDGLSFKSGRVGIFIRYSSTNHNNVSIRNCDFDYFTDGPTVTMDKTNTSIDRSNGQIAFASAIFVGGVISQMQWEETVLDGWEVKDCNFNYCDGSVSNNWYRQVFYKDRMKNTFIENILIKDFSICAISLNQINGVSIKNVELYNSILDVFTEFGIAGMFFHGCSNMIIDNYTVKEINRGYSGDGASIDFEYCKNILVKNSYFGNIDGMGLELLDTTPFIFDMEFLPDRWLLGYNRNLIVQDTIFYNTSRRPHTLPSGEDLFFDVYNRNAKATVNFDNVVFFEGRGSHGTLSSKTKEFSMTNTIRVDLDLVLYQESKIASYNASSDLPQPIRDESPINKNLIIIVSGVVLFVLTMLIVYKVASKK